MLTGEGSKKPGAQAHRCQGPPHPGGLAFSLETPVGAIPAREVFGCVSSRPHALYEWLHFYLIAGNSIQPLKTPRCYFTQFLLLATEKHEKLFDCGNCVCIFFDSERGFCLPIGYSPGLHL